MPRYHWFDSVLDTHSAPVVWVYVALLTATLFLNLPFWYMQGMGLLMSCPLPAYASILGITALLITALFFVGPALASHTAGRPLLDVIENSLGSVPAHGIRLCCVGFLVVWIAELIAVPASWWSRYTLRWEMSSTESGVAITLLVIFLFLTSLQSFRTSAEVALFTNKLGLAILIAALIRVRGWLPSALDGPLVSGELLQVSEIWHGVSLLIFDVAPLIFLAADFGYRLQGRKQIAMTAGLGITLPLFGTLLLVGVINVAAFSSPYYRPSLTPNITMPLWGQVARSALPWLLMITTITIFGAVRFGARVLLNTLLKGIPAGRLVWASLGCLAGLIAWRPFIDEANIRRFLAVSATFVVVTAAVVTGDFVSGRRRNHHSRRVDCAGMTALLAGLATACCTSYWIGPDGSWWQPWLLPSYGVGFLTCVAGRALQKRLVL